MKIEEKFIKYENLLKDPIFTKVFKSDGENSDTVVNINTITWDQFNLTDLKTPLSQEELDKKLEE